MRTSFALVFLLAATSSAQSLDTKASLVDVNRQPSVLAKHVELAPIIAHLYRCTTLAPIPAPPSPMEIPHHYLQGSSGPTNPAEREATRVYERFEARITAGADRYLATGDHVEAVCALQQLDLWAKADALYNYDPEESSQAWFQSEWTLSSAGMAMSVLVNDPRLDPATVQRVLAWLNKAVHRNIGFEREGKDNNNHHYWRALAATSIGIVSNDRKLFDFGVAAYKEAIGDIDERGAFPKEMVRHENAIHYQAFALQPLVIVAQLALRQGIDLYSYSAHGRTLRDAIVFLGKAVADPSLAKPYTADKQNDNFKPGDFSELAFYVAQFGKKDLTSRLVSSASTASFDTRIGGNMLIFAAK